MPKTFKISCFVNLCPLTRGNVKCFLAKSAKKPGNVKYVKCLALSDLIWPQTSNIFSIFNFSGVLNRFRRKKKHLTFPLFREFKVTNMGNVKCVFNPYNPENVKYVNVWPFGVSFGPKHWPQTYLTLPGF